MISVKINDFVQKNHWYQTELEASGSKYKALPFAFLVFKPYLKSPHSLFTLPNIWGSTVWLKNRLCCLLCVLLYDLRCFLITPGPLDSRVIHSSLSQQIVNKTLLLVELTSGLLTLIFVFLHGPVPSCLSQFISLYFCKCPLS